MVYRLRKSFKCWSGCINAKNVGEFISWGPYNDLNSAFRAAQKYNEATQCDCKVEVVEA